MPDWKDCVRYNDKVYRWDSAEGRVVIIKSEPVDFRDCPECVMSEVIRKIEKNGR
jgi:hypothetical protein